MGCVVCRLGGCSDGGDQSVQLLHRAGRAEHVAVRAYQNGRSVDCLKPGSQLGRVIDHDRDIAIREALERFRRQARGEVRRQ